jgi:hypothetical protein
MTTVQDLLNSELPVVGARVTVGGTPARVGNVNGEMVWVYLYDHNGFVVEGESGWLNADEVALGWPEKS